MPAKLTREDFCPGYVAGKRSPLGRCCCGLWWEGVMPPHLVSGEPIDLNMLRRIERRERDASEAAARKASILAASRPASLVFGKGAS